MVGAFWYLLSIERQDQCWRNWCGAHNVSCSYLYCGGDRIHNGLAERYALLNASCPLSEPDGIENSTVFNFGIFIKALQSRVVETRDFPCKFSYCFWWGLRNIRFVHIHEFHNLFCFPQVNYYRCHFQHYN